MNKLISVTAVFFLLLSIFLASCSKKEVLHTQDDLAYFPLLQGRYITYAVDSIVYDDFYNSTDTVSYQLMEVIGDTLTDNTGAVVYKVMRYQRTDISQEWSLVNVWQQKVDGNMVERIEGNLRFIKLALPLSSYKRWDTNAYLDIDTVFAIRGASIAIYKDWDQARYIQIDQPAVVGAFNLDSTLLVEHVDSENAIERRFSTERYAKNIGLVYKKMMILDTQCSQYPNGIADCIDLPWEIKAEKGFILTMTMIDHN